MRLVTNRWQPDTCDCIIEFEFDADEPEATRTHTGKTIVKDCPEHSGLGTPQSFFNAILDENQRKNIVRKDLIDNFTQLQGTDDKGNIILKNGISINFYFTGQDDSRVLHISVSGYTLTTQQKTTIQNIADSRFGIGKVVIE